MHTSTRGILQRYIYIYVISRSRITPQHIKYNSKPLDVVQSLYFGSKLPIYIYIYIYVCVCQIAYTTYVVVLNSEFYTHKVLIDNSMSVTTMRKRKNSFLKLGFRNIFGTLNIYIYCVILC